MYACITHTHIFTNSRTAPKLAVVSNFIIFVLLLLLNTEASPLDSATESEEETVKRKSSQVNFDPMVLDKAANKISRDLTPFPKDLHNKAMQWRASRDIAVGSGRNTTTEEAGAGEKKKGVPLRLHPKKSINNRNSLLTALSEPLDEVGINYSHMRLLSFNLTTPITNCKHNNEFSKEVEQENFIMH